MALISCIPDFWGPAVPCGKIEKRKTQGFWLFPKMEHYLLQQRGGIVQSTVPRYVGGVLLVVVLSSAGAQSANLAFSYLGIPPLPLPSGARPSIIDERVRSLPVQPIVD